MALTVVLLIVAFVITGIATRMYHRRRTDLANTWFHRGTSDFAAGRPADAVGDFRSALVYAREVVPAAQQQAYELDLARALAATNRVEEARSYLLDLWQATPGDAEINLELARLATRTGDEASAKLYYNGAIYGVWDGDATQVLRERLDTQRELYKYLSALNQTAAARAVLQAMAASLPPDPALHIQLGQLLLDAGQNMQALAEFEAAIRMGTHDPAAWAGAGQASFALDDDRQAARYLGEASRAKPRQSNPAPSEEEAQVTRNLAIAQATLSLDPSQTGTSAAERARRAARAYEIAVSRLQSCARQSGEPLAEPSRKQAAAGGPQGPADSLQSLYAKAVGTKGSAQETALSKNSQLIDRVMGLVSQIEVETSMRCGPPRDVNDVALLRIGARADGTTRP